MFFDIQGTNGAKQSQLINISTTTIMNITRNNTLCESFWAVYLGVSLISRYFHNRPTHIYYCIYFILYSSYIITLVQ